MKKGKAQTSAQHPLLSAHQEIKWKGSESSRMKGKVPVAPLVLKYEAYPRALTKKATLLYAARQQVIPTMPPCHRKCSIHLYNPFCMYLLFSANKHPASKDYTMKSICIWRLASFALHLYLKLKARKFCSTFVLEVEGLQVLLYICTWSWRLANFALHLYLKLKACRFC